MFSDNQRISGKQMKCQMILSLVGILLLFQAGEMAAGGVNSLLGMVIGLGLLILYLFFLVRVSAVYSNLERYFGCIGKWLITVVYLSFLVLSGSYLLEKVSFVTERYLLSGVPLPVISAVFVLAACMGMGNEIQRRGRLAELCFPWILVALILLLAFAAFHFHGLDFSLMEPWSAVKVTEGVYRYFTMGTSVSLAAFLLSRVDKGNSEKSGGTFRSLTMGLIVVTLLLLAAAAVLLGVYGFRGIRNMEFPILDLMAGTSLPGNFLKRFDIVWLAVLIFSLLFSLGSILFYGCWLTGRNGIRRDWSRLIMAGLIWLGSLIEWSGKTVSDIYSTVLQDIYAPVFLLITVLGLWAQKRFRNDKERRDSKNERYEAEMPEKVSE